MVHLVAAPNPDRGRTHKVSGAAVVLPHETARSTRLLVPSRVSTNCLTFRHRYRFPPFPSPEHLTGLGDSTDPLGNPRKESVRTWSPRHIRKGGKPSHGIFSQSLHWFCASINEREGKSVGCVGIEQKEGNPTERSKPSQSRRKKKRGGRTDLLLTGTTGRA